MKEQITERFPGIGCAWMDETGNIATEYVGFADREKQIAVDQSTIFPACSISKFITALCVMQWHEQMKIDIDRPVNVYLDQWKLRTQDGKESDTTIRALLCHTGGVIDGEEAFYGLRWYDAQVTLMDILEGRTAYNPRATRSEKPHGTAFEYSDAGYCVLQMLIEEVAKDEFAKVAQKMIFEKLGLKNTFFASAENIAKDERNKRMTTGYDGDGKPIPGRFPPCPDLAASGLWSTPEELLMIAKEFIAALNGQSFLLQAESARQMAKPVERFPWTGLGLFMGDKKDVLMTQGWGEHGQCMMKMNVRTGEISVVMTNRNPEVDQVTSGVEWLVDQKMSKRL